MGIFIFDFGLSDKVCVPNGVTLSVNSKFPRSLANTRFEPDRAGVLHGRSGSLFRSSGTERLPVGLRLQAPALQGVPRRKDLPERKVCLRVPELSIGSHQIKYF